ncbi:hypothetical protein HPB50_001902 [Hyalomma asiaticum]|uniref:Uncharacterized protein n=1 Tax=Hyalomma asiaticum TaxID=266040 RepID=A0ACB7TAD3_HYAAI|nr:hypothetical protein HPB50_001902 [Hyalomma asiaticum]
MLSPRLTYERIEKDFKPTSIAGSGHPGYSDQVIQTDQAQANGQPAPPCPGPDRCQSAPFAGPASLATLSITALFRVSQPVSAEAVYPGRRCAYQSRPTVL